MPFVALTPPNKLTVLFMGHEHAKAGLACRNSRGVRHKKKPHTLSAEIQLESRNKVKLKSSEIHYEIRKFNPKMNTQQISVN